MNVKLPSELARPPRRISRHIIASALWSDWSQFEPVAALRCTIAVAVPLIAALVMNAPTVGVFGAVGALSVGFGSFQGAYRSRAATMLCAAGGMAISIGLGTVAGHAMFMAIVLVALWGFVSGLLVALGPAASFVGLQSTVAVIIATGFPAGVEDAIGRSLLVCGGGLLQTLLVVLVWPLRRFPAERRAVATVYRSLSAYAGRIPQESGAPPEPHTLAGIGPTLSDPQPFARARELLVFQALLDEAERIRAALAALAREHARLTASGNEHDVQRSEAVSRSAAQVLLELATAIGDGRGPRADPDVWRDLTESVDALRPHNPAAELVATQLHAAWRTAGVPAATGGPTSVAHGQVPRLFQIPPIRDGLHTLRANLTIQSTACRHALRLAVTLAIATGLYQVLALPRGYWAPLTAVIVLKPEFSETFSRGIARVLGTLFGAGAATVITIVLEPGAVMLTALVLAFVWAGYALFRTNYAIFTVCITAYIVFLLGLTGVAEATTAEYRILYTTAGGALALIAYGVWPTWTGPQVRQLLADLLEALGRHTAAVLAGYADPAAVDLDVLQDLRAAGRLARSNAEAAVDRMLVEPADRQTLPPHVAMGVLAAARRYALSALALHAGLEHGPREVVRQLEPVGGRLQHALDALARAIRDGGEPPVPAIAVLQPPMRTAAARRILDEVDMMVDSTQTVAALLARHAEPHGHDTVPAAIADLTR
jgi:hypothetical protein